MARDKFRTVKGDLTQYALACGYIQRATSGDSRQLDLWFEGACYHVRYYREGFRVYWESFGNLTDARALYHNERRRSRLTQHP